MLFRGLVGVTCIAVLAAIGFYFWRDNQDREAALARETAMHNAAISTECRQILASLSAGRSEGLTVGHGVACVRAGAFTTDDMRSRGFGPAADAVDEHIATYPRN